MSYRMTLDHIDTITADNRNLTTRIAGLEAERDHHRVGLVRVRAEANAALARAAELEAALLALVEAMPVCDNCGKPATIFSCDGYNDHTHGCDACGGLAGVVKHAAALRAALLLLAKGGK